MENKKTHSISLLKYISTNTKKGLILGERINIIDSNIKELQDWLLFLKRNKIITPFNKNKNKNWFIFNIKSPYIKDFIGFLLQTDFEKFYNSKFINIKISHKGKIYNCSTNIDLNNNEISNEREKKIKNILNNLKKLNFNNPDGTRIYDFKTTKRIKYIIKINNY
jgi:hypothetical protein